MAESELDRLVPDETPVELPAAGITVEVVRMRTRQFFRLLKILTHGAGPAVLQAGLDFTGDADEFTRRLLTLVVMSIPDAENEAMDFIQAMCQPQGLVRGPKLNKQQTEANRTKIDEFSQALANPELEDTLELITVIIRNEAPELQSLGKKAAALLKVAGLTEDEKPETPPGVAELAQMNGSPAPSPTASTSSATSTGGPTTTSSRSRSAGSGNASRRRQPAVSASK